MAEAVHAAVRETETEQVLAPRIHSAHHVVERLGVDGVLLDVNPEKEVVFSDKLGQLEELQVIDLESKRGRSR